MGTRNIPFSWIISRVCRSAPCPVLDRIDAGDDRILDPFRRSRMSGYFEPLLVRFFHDNTHFFNGQRWMLSICSRTARRANQPHSRKLANWQVYTIALFSHRLPANSTSAKRQFPASFLPFRDIPAGKRRSLSWHRTSSLSGTPTRGHSSWNRAPLTSSRGVLRKTSGHRAAWMSRPQTVGEQRRGQAVLSSASPVAHRMNHARQRYPARSEVLTLRRVRVYTRQSCGSQ